MMDLPELEATHNYEERLRRESLRLIATDHDLRKRFRTIEKSMNLIYGYTIDYVEKTNDERAIELLGVRLFNAAASGVKLALSGYYQTAFRQTRDIMEIGLLLDYFRISPTQIPFWKASDTFARRKYFNSSKIRNALDEHDGDGRQQRRAEYHQLSQLASRATYRGFAPMKQQDVAEFGPFIEKENLRVWARETVLRLGASAIMYANHLPNADATLMRCCQEFAREFDREFQENAPGNSQGNA